MHKKYNAYLIDLDGTIHLGNQIIPSGKRFIERLQEKDIPFLLVTNNTTKTPQMVANRLKKEFGIYVSASDVYTAAAATIDFMRNDGKGNKVYVIGEEGLIRLIAEAGFKWSEVSPDYVVVGLDKHVTYDKLSKAALAIQNNATFIGTNPDKSLPTEKGLIPGAGALISFIQTATQTEPIIIGKPNPLIMNEALEKLKVTKEEAVMVGDNYETDIQAGILNGIDSLLVLSGFTTHKDLETLPIQPTYVLDCLNQWSL